VSRLISPARRSKILQENPTCLRRELNKLSTHCIGSSRTGPRFFSTRPSQATGWMPSYYKESFVWCQKVQGLNLSAKPQNPVQKSCPSALLEPTLQRAVWLLAPTQDGMGWARASREHRTYHLTNLRCKRLRV